MWPCLELHSRGAAAANGAALTATPFSLRRPFAGTTLRATVDDDQRLERLRDLIREVVKLQDTTNRLIAELSDRLRRSESANKTPARKERRKKPR